MHHKFIVADVVSTARGLDLDAVVLSSTSLIHGIPR